MAGINLDKQDYAPPPFESDSGYSGGINLDKREEEPNYYGGGGGGGINLSKGDEYEVGMDDRGDAAPPPFHDDDRPPSFTHDAGGSAAGSRNQNQSPNGSVAPAV